MFYIWQNFLSQKKYSVEKGLELTDCSLLYLYNSRTGGSVVEHRAAMREVTSSSPAGPTLRVLK